VCVWGGGGGGVCMPESGMHDLPLYNINENDQQIKDGWIFSRGNVSKV
jgi:hypothetical protein